jgi:hypothetical protein
MYDEYELMDLPDIQPDKLRNRKLTLAQIEDLNNQLTDESALLQSKHSSTDEAIRQLIYDLIDGSVERAAS